MVISPSGHENWAWELKSPVKNTVNGFSALILEYNFLKLDKKALKVRGIVIIGRTSI